MLIKYIIGFACCQIQRKEFAENQSWKLVNDSTQMPCHRTGYQAPTVQSAGFAEWRGTDFSFDKKWCSK